MNNIMDYIQKENCRLFLFYGFMFGDITEDEIQLAMGELTKGEVYEKTTECMPVEISCRFKMQGDLRDKEQKVH